MESIKTNERPVPIKELVKALESDIFETRLAIIVRISKGGVVQPKASDIACCRSKGHKNVWIEDWPDMFYCTRCGTTHPHMEN